jgi:hypothetical protein
MVPLLELPPNEAALDVSWFSLPWNEIALDVSMLLDCLRQKRHGYDLIKQHERRGSGQTELDGFDFFCIRLAHRRQRSVVGSEDVLVG